MSNAFQPSYGLQMAGMFYKVPLANFWMEWTQPATTLTNDEQDLLHPPQNIAQSSFA